jgi:hypothetical protein
MAECPLGVTAEIGAPLDKTKKLMEYSIIEIIIIER